MAAVRLQELLTHDDAAVSCIRLGRASSTLFATGAENGEVAVWAVGHGVPISILRSGGSSAPRVEALAFDRDEDVIAAGSADSCVRVFDVEDSGGSAVRALDFNPVAGEVLAVGAADPALRLWDIRSRRKPSHIFSGHRGGVQAVGFSPDGLWVASGDAEGAVRVWDLAAARIVQEFSMPAAVSALAFHPREVLLAAAAVDGNAFMWDLQRRRRVAAPLARSSAGLRTLTFGGDCGSLLVGSTADGVSVWEWEGASTAAADGGFSERGMAADKKGARDAGIRGDERGTASREAAAGAAAGAGWTVQPDEMPVRWEGRLGDAIVAQGSLLAATWSGLSRTSIWLVPLDRLGNGRVGEDALERAREARAKDEEERPCMFVEDRILEADGYGEYREPQSSVGGRAGKRGTGGDEGGGGVGGGRRGEAPEPDTWQDAKSYDAEAGDDTDDPVKRQAQAEAVASMFKRAALISDGYKERRRKAAAAAAATASSAARVAARRSEVASPLASARASMRAVPGSSSMQRPASASAAVRGHGTLGLAANGHTHEKRTYETAGGASRTLGRSSSGGALTDLRAERRSDGSAAMTEERGGALAAAEDGNRLRPDGVTAGMRHYASGVESGGASPSPRVAGRYGSSGASSGGAVAAATAPRVSPGSVRSSRAALPLDVSAFLPAEDAAAPDVAGEVDDVAVISSLLAQNRAVKTVLRSRLATLQVARALWTKGDFKGSMAIVAKAGDQAVLVDMMNVLVERPEVLSLEAASVLLPTLPPLLSSQHARYRGLAIEAGTLLLRCFAGLIKSTLAAVPHTGIGVDVMAEMRHERCGQCQQAILALRDALLRWPSHKPNATAGGSLSAAPTAQEATNVANLLAAIEKSFPSAAGSGG